MACDKKRLTGQCSHFQCPTPDETEHGYECLDIFNGVCEGSRESCPPCQYKERPKPFEKLSDSPVFEDGDTEVWYQKPDLFGTFGYGDNKPDPKNLARTHRLLGTVKEDDPERLFMLLQGEAWSPMGQANKLIKDKGLGHTSMSVGDVIVTKGKVCFCASIGFETL